MRNFTLLFLYLLAVATLYSQSELTVTEIMYNSPGEDLEFIEFYNPNTTVLDLTGYALAEGVNYTFPSISIDPQSTFVITNDSLKFQRFYGLSVNQWEAGSLNNGGELISITNGALDTILNFTYNDNQPWSQMADGGGTSLTRCDITNDINLPDSWERSTILARDEEGTPVFADPGIYDGCSTQGQSLLAPSTTEMFVLEEVGTIEIEYYLDNAPDSILLFQVITEASSTAELDADYAIINDTLEFNTNKNSAQTLEIEILTDALEEDIEFLDITLSPLNSNLMLTTTTRVNIISCNQLSPAKIKLRGVIHSSEIKAIELIVLEDLTLEESRTYSIGSANNGGGTDGPEFLLNAAASSGSCLFVTNDTIRFKTFFGTTDNMQLIQDEELDADYNGNDAIELYQTCNLIDTYGEADVNGEGTVWDYDKGWAKRIAQNEDSTPSDFNSSDWIFSGKDNLDADTNSESIAPYIIECIILDTEDLVNTTNLELFPNPTMGQLTIKADHPIDQVFIYNQQGQRLYQAYNIEATTHNLNLENQLTPSVYLVQCVVDGHTITRKVMIK